MVKIGLFSSISSEFDIQVSSDNGNFPQFTLSIGIIQTCSVLCDLGARIIDKINNFR